MKKLMVVAALLAVARGAAAQSVPAVQEAARPDFAGRWVMDTSKFTKHDAVLLALELTLTMRADTVFVVATVLDQVGDSTATFKSTTRYLFGGGGVLPNAMPGMPGAPEAPAAEAAWDGAALVLTRSSTSAGGRSARITERWMLDATGTTMTRMLRAIIAGREQAQTLVFTRRPLKQEL